MAEVNLPDGWLATNLGSLVELKYGKSLPAQSRDGESFPVYGSNGIVGKHSKPLLTSPGLIIGRKGSYGEVQFSSTPFFPIDTTYFIDEFYDQPIRYWYYQLKFLPLTELNRSTAIPGLNREDAYEQPIALPPLAEQKVIAEQLDTLLAQVDNTKARLERIPEILKTFRQSVLAAAVSGKLTEEWRGDNSCSDISDLIKKLSSFIKSKKILELADKPISAEEITILPPSDWTWVRLSKIADIASGIAKGSKSNGQTVSRPYLRVANVQRGYLNLDEIKEIEVSPDKALSLKLQYGDILFNEGGDIDKLGRGWIWESQIDDCIHQNHVFRARCFSEKIEPKFISFYSNSEGKEYFLRNGTQSVNLASINKTTLSLLPIPMPSPEEQTEIVRRVEELFAFADRIEHAAQAALSRVNNLTQSILAKAFRGELTADWRAANPELISGENSAEALLAKIKAEREKLKSTKKAKA